jgi:hypothetical protein
LAGLLLLILLLPLAFGELRHHSNGDCGDAQWHFRPESTMINYFFVVLGRRPPG